MMTLLLVYLGVFVLGMLLFPLSKSFYTNKKKQVVVKDLNLFTGAFAYFWIFAGVLLSSFLYSDLLYVRSLVAGLSLTLVVLYLSYKPMSLKIQNCIDFVVCFGGAYLFLPTEISLSLPVILLLLITAAFWFLSWRVFRSFDKYPFVSSVMSCVWMLSFIIAGQIVRGMPVAVMVISGFIGVVSFVCFRKRVKLSITTMGPEMASLIGFLWAGIWSFFFLGGDYFPAVCGYAYYLFELAVIAYMAFKGRTIQPLFLSALQDDRMGHKAIKVFFWDILLISLLAVFVMFFRQSASLFLLICVLLFLIYFSMQLRHISHPAPTYADIFAEMKKTVRGIYTQSKLALVESGLEKKTKIPQKKKAPVKKKQKSKGKKKK